MVGKDMDMEEVGKSVLTKISSYNIFNNFLPGIIFCYMVKFFTGYELDIGSNWQNIFIYYFWGLVISRVGSIVIEHLLLKITIKSRRSKTKGKYIKLAPYEEYSRASEKQSFIKTLNETNNVYRTMTSVFVCVLMIKLYEVISVYVYQFIGGMGIIKDILLLLGGMILFIMSYKKQTDYIRKRVQEFIVEEGGGE